MKINYLTLSILSLTAVSLFSCSMEQKEGQEAGKTPATEEVASIQEISSDIDLQSSVITWAGTMIGVYTHTGTMAFSAGKIQAEGEKVKGGSFTVDMTSIKTTDDNYDVSNHKTPEKLIGHLSSPDFFDVADHPTASFEISGSEGNRVLGKLTIRGITHEETVENVSYNETENSWTGKLVFDRKKYDVVWDSPMKEMVLSDSIELNITVSI